MARHARSGPARDVLKHRLTVSGCALGVLVAFCLAYVDRDDRPSVLLWSGLGLFLGAMTVIVASLSIGPRPLGSFGVGAWMLGGALGAGLAWMGRDSEAAQGDRWVAVPPFMLLLAVGLVPLGVWLMLWRPEQNWEKEFRDERNRNRTDDAP